MTDPVLERFRAAHAGDPPPPMDDSRCEYGVLRTRVSLLGGLGPSRYITEQGRLWRGTKADAEKMVERLNGDDRFQQGDIYNVVRILHEPSPGV